jgi:pyrroline-5-carboxylate reductase
MQEVLASLAPHVTGEHLIVSIAAGITLGTIEAALGEHTRVVRVMPNTPALGEPKLPGLGWAGLGWAVQGWSVQS